MTRSSLRERVDHTRRIATVGAGPLGQLKLAFLTNWYLLQRRIGSSQWPRSTVSVREGERVTTLHVTSAADIGVLEEIFVRRDYDISLRRSPATILDLGSNFGASVAFFRMRYPAATIFAFEPAGRTFEQLRENAREMGNVRVFREAVAGSAGEGTLHSAPSRSAGASLVSRTKNTKSETVTTVTLDDVLARERIDWIDLMKFDVEGSEVEIFRQARCIDKIGELIGEYHPDLTGLELPAFLALFPNFDCTIVSTSGQRCIVHLTNRALTGA